ncbi:GIY-YIG nuclease family protein [Chryseobacterium sp. APV1]|uniref:GIY-YIG nuclease family protein n=1 Tax=Chryseobacterium urinae TaxID=3058400 RepID=A0ABT8TZN7_9FLAO|nr:GIY-YIG nuclease family protein [Chryseobacterium sp. APV1]MDO3424274.1 GIY-YIG nuclease family protein [Chryseobacterium sp. APV1]
MAKTLDDIFNEDDFGLLDSSEKKSVIKTDEDRLIESFEEINSFFEKNKREPSNSSIAEYSLLARLKEFRNNDSKKKMVKPFDRFNLLGKVEYETPSIDEILNDDELGLLDSDGDNSIFEFKHTPQIDKRAKAESIAQRKSLSDDDFAKYEVMFQNVHRDLKSGRRKMLPFNDAETNLKQGNFYLVDGLLVYLESSDAEKTLKENKTGDRIRLDGPTTTIFENGTVSNLLFRSLGKAIQKNGKLITQPLDDIEKDLAVNAGMVKEEDIESGWIYILKSKSQNPEIKNIKNLYKIGFSTVPVETRIKNATKEATYLYDNVAIVAKYSCYNINIQNFENLLHRLFASVCLDIDLYDASGKRFIPREWFVVPIDVLNEAIELFINGSIINYRFDNLQNKIVLK